MLLNKLKNRITIANSISSWQDAIRLCSKPLLCQGYITNNYIDDMINNVIKNGPYMIIMPLVALPHSRPESGVNKTGLSLLKLNEPVLFPDDTPVQLLFTLAANQNDEHMDLISELSEFLIGPSNIPNLLNANSVEEIEKCL